MKIYIDTEEVGMLLTKDPTRGGIRLYTTIHGMEYRNSKPDEFDINIYEDTGLTTFDILEVAKEMRRRQHESD